MKQSKKLKVLKAYKKFWLFLPVLFALVTVGLFWLFTHSNTDNHNSNLSVSDKCEAGNTVTFACYKNLLTDITNQSQPEVAFSLVKQEYSKVSYIKSQCHQLTHVIGRAAFAKYDNIADTFAHGDQFCWSGYYHGAIEELTKEKGYDYTLKNANNICSVFSGKEKYSFSHYNCVHGLGHGFMFVTEDEFFDALKACDIITDNWERSSCWGGVFMQNIMNVQGPDAAEADSYPYLKADEPMYPCTAIEDKYKQQCYLMQTSYALQVVGYDFTKVFELCAEAPDEYQATCYQSIGRNMNIQEINIDKTRSTCLIGPSREAVVNCFNGAAKGITISSKDNNTAMKFCRSLMVEFEDECRESVSDFYK